MTTQTRIDRAIAVSLPFWRQEYAIGYRAFASPAIYADGLWLAVQIEKERTGSGVYGPSDVPLIPRDQLAEEHVHAELLRRLAPLMTGPLPHAPALASGFALVALRDASWRDPALSLAVAMSEGGGLGLFKGALAAIADRAAPRPQDGSVAACLARIVEDERDHIAAGFAAFAAANGRDDDAILARLAEILHLKVAERREQFAAPLEVATVEADSADYAVWAAAAFVTAP